ncbi:MAG: site-specific integrase [Gemmatimonadales bacterium]
MTQQKRERGAGRVYLRGSTWWIAYSVMGRKYRESSGSKDRRKADKLLRRRLGEVMVGRHAPQAERVTFEDLAAMLEADYRANGRRSLDRARRSLAQLRRAFGQSRAVAITGDRLTTYVTDRLAEGAARATVAAELAALRRGFTLAIQAGRLLGRPHFPTLSLDNARQGFVSDADFGRLAAALPVDIAAPIRFAFLTGWRLRSEVLPLAWDRVDFEAGEVRLFTSKNGEPRVFPFSALPELADLLEGQRQVTREVEKTRHCIVPRVFHRNGRPIRDLRGAWEAACKAAGILGLVPHDLRRSAVRRLERAGVPRSVAMKLTGHKTESVYRRYAIVAKSDLAEGVAKLASLQPERLQSGRSLTLRRGTVGAQ